MVEITKIPNTSTLQLKPEGSVETVSVSLFMCPSCPLHPAPGVYLCSGMNMSTHLATVNGMTVQEVKAKAGCNPQEG